MADKPKRGTFIHGIAASEHLDSSGERIKIDGVDISSLTRDGTFNYEHDSKSPASIVGKILEAKKILKYADCENDNHKYFWDKIKMPFIYVAGELFDSVGHKQAGEVAAMVRYDQLDAMNKDAKKLINFSIEGNRVEKTGQVITKCIARKVSVTLTPCNKVCEAEELKISSDAKSEADSGKFSFIQDIMSKSDEPSCQIMKGEIPFLYKNTEIDKSIEDQMFYEAHRKQLHAAGKARRAKIEHRKKNPTVVDKLKTWAKEKIKPKQAPKKPIEHVHEDSGKIAASEKNVIIKKKLGKYDSNVRKALTASCGMGVPSAKVQGDAVAKSEFLYKNENVPAQNSNGVKIGRTKSGKDVFSHAKVGEYQGFSPQDHLDAAEFHRQMVLKLPSFKDKERHMNKLTLHNQAFQSGRNKMEMQRQNTIPSGAPMQKPMMAPSVAIAPKPNPAQGTAGYSAFASNYGKEQKPAANAPAAAPVAPAAAPKMNPNAMNPNLKIAKSEFLLIRQLGNSDVNKASYNVREQRKKVFGTKSQPGANTAMREKHIAHIKNFVKQFMNLDLQPSGGKVNEKTGERRNEVNEAGVDKPDWRSGSFEAQWNPEAIVHEIAHLMLLPKGVGLEAGQQLMDKQYGDVQKEHGYMQQKRSKYEVQPMAAEQLVRRFLGLPASQVSIPVKSKDDPHRVALENQNEIIGTRIKQGKQKDGQDKYVDLIRQSRNLHPEHKQRLAEIFSGNLVFDPDKGWSPKNRSLDAAITNRPAGAVMARQAKKQSVAPSQELPPNVVRMKQPAPAAPAPAAAAPQQQVNPEPEQPPMKIAKSEQPMQPQASTTHSYVGKCTDIGKPKSKLTACGDATQWAQLTEQSYPINRKKFEAHTGKTLPKAIAYGAHPQHGFIWAETPHPDGQGTIHHYFFANHDAGAAQFAKKQLIAKSEQRKIMKMLGDQAFDAFEKKEELMAFLAEKLPKLSERERKAIAKAVAYTSEKKKELALKELMDDNG